MTSTGLCTDTRRIGAIASGPPTALGPLTVLGHRGIGVGCAVVTVVARVAIAVAARRPAPPRPA